VQQDQTVSEMAEEVLMRQAKPSGCSGRYGVREAARIPKRPIHPSAWK
jgi:hypothetical protein